MELVIMEEAARQLKTIMQRKQILKLFYDTEGCGCGVSGIPMVKIADKPGEKDIKIDCSSHGISVYIHEKEKMFFDEAMTITFQNGVFRLKSPNEILNPMISIHILMRGA